MYVSIKIISFIFCLRFSFLYFFSTLFWLILAAVLYYLDYLIKVFIKAIFFNLRDILSGDEEERKVER